MSYKNHLPLLLALLLAGAAAASCRPDKDPNADRADYIDVYAAPEDQEPLTAHSLSVQGGPARLYVRTNLEGLKVQWQDEDTTPWAKVVAFENVSGDLYALDLEVKPRYSYPYYTRRTGSLMLSSPENNFGTFLKVHQGLVARIASDMSWSKYGSNNPLKLDGAISATWNAADKNRHWDSTILPGQTDAHLYGKNGYLMLGDGEGHGADLYTPYLDANQAVKDSLFVLSFRAVAFNDKKGNKDANKLAVEIIGGGALRDDTSKTRIDLEVPYFNPSAEDLTGEMWNDAYFLVGFIRTEDNAFSPDTRIRFIAGDVSGASGTPNRIYIDNVYIRTLTLDPVKRIYDEDLWTLNGGSGADRIISTTPTE